MTREMKIGSVVAGSFLSLVGIVVGTKVYNRDIPQAPGVAQASTDEKKDGESPRVFPPATTPPGTLPAAFMSTEPLPPPTAPNFPTIPAKIDEFKLPPIPTPPNLNEMGNDLAKTLEKKIDEQNNLVRNTIDDAKNKVGQVSNDLNNRGVDFVNGLNKGADQFKNDLKNQANTLINSLPPLPNPSNLTIPGVAVVQADPKNPTPPGGSTIKPSFPPPPDLNSKKPELSLPGTPIVGGGATKPTPPPSVPISPSGTNLPGLPPATPGFPTPPAGTPPGATSLPPIAEPKANGLPPIPPPVNTPTSPSSLPPPPTGTTPPIGTPLTSPPIAPPTIGSPPPITTPTPPISTPSSNLPPVSPSGINLPPPTTPPLTPPITNPSPTLPTGVIPGPPDVRPLTPTVPPISTNPPSLPPITTSVPVVKSDTAERHVVQGNETYNQIAIRKYGSDRYARALEEYNRDYPGAPETLRAPLPRLTPGTPVMLPSLSYLLDRYGRFVATSGSNLPPVTTGNPGNVRPLSSDVGISPPTPVPSGVSTKTEPAGLGTFRVPAGGMYLSQIAERQLGSPLRWIDIYRLNPTLQPEQPVREGTDVRVPMK